jgi:uncharacterized protein YjgD (DUF1641 family)
MAKPVEFRPVPRPAIEETKRKLEAAPLEHAEAVLNAYRTLQMLHDSDTLDMVRGLLGAGDTVLNESVSVLTSAKSMRAIRNLLVLLNLAGEIDPQLLHSLADSLTPLVKPPVSPPEPPSLFQLARRLFSRDVRRVLAIGVATLETLGRGMGQRQD